MCKLIIHIKRWCIWRRVNMNNKTYKFLVLLGVCKSPSFSMVMTKEESIAFSNAIKESIEKGVNNQLVQTVKEMVSNLY